MRQLFITVLVRWCLEPIRWNCHPATRIDRTCRACAAMGTRCTRPNQLSMLFTGCFHVTCQCWQGLYRIGPCSANVDCDHIILPGLDTGKRSSMVGGSIDGSCETGGFMSMSNILFRSSSNLTHPGIMINLDCVTIDSSVIVIGGAGVLSATILSRLFVGELQRRSQGALMPYPEFQTESTHRTSFF